MKLRWVPPWMISIILGLLCATSALAEPGLSETNVVPESDRVGFGFDLGWATALLTRERQEGKDVTKPRMLVISPHMRYRLHESRRSDRWYDGRLDAVLEPSLLINFEPHTGVAGALSAGLRYRFAPAARVSPYVIGLLGVGGIGFDLANQGDGFQWFLQGGVGLRFRLSAQTAITTSVRFHHISTGQTHYPNDGIDSLVALIGFEL